MYHHDLPWRLFTSLHISLFAQRTSYIITIPIYSCWCNFVHENKTTFTEQSNLKGNPVALQDFFHEQLIVQTSPPCRKQDMLGRTFWLPAAIICCSKFLLQQGVQEMEINQKKYSIRHTFHWYCLLFRFASNRNRHLGQAASGKWFLQWNLAIPNVHKCFNNFVFLRKTCVVSDFLGMLKTHWSKTLLF